MPVFFILATLLAALIFIGLAWLWSRPAQQAADHAENDPEWQVMLARRREIEEDLQLSSETRATLRAEWLATADAAMALSRRDTTLIPSRSALSALALLVLCIAVATYATFGQWEPAALQFAAPSAASAERDQAEQFKAEMAERITQLEARLKNKPDDLDGWLLLARSHFFTDNYAAAAAALEHALKLAPRNPAVLADLADSLAAASPDHSLSGRPLQLVQQALSIDPRHPKSLALAASEAMDRKDNATAITYWKRLRDVLPAEGEQHDRVEAVLAGLGAPVTAAAPDAAKAKAGDAALTIKGRLSFSSGLMRQAREGKLPAEAVLFIFARTADSSGGPPLAALRLPLAQAMQKSPFPFELDDSLSMNPANKLSAAKLVDVEARIAMSGSVQKQASDIRFTVKGIKPGTSGVVLQMEVAP